MKNFLESFSKYHKVIIMSIIGLALFSLIDKTLAVGVILIVFLSSVTLFFINKIKEKETIKFLGVLFLVVFLMHILMVVFVYYTNFQPFSNGRGDYNEYHLVAETISKRVSQGNFSLEGLPLTHYYPIIVGYLYFVTTKSMLMGQLLNAWMVALMAVFVFLITLEMGRSKKEGFIVGLMVSFYPSLAFYGSLLLKDALVVLLSVIGLLLTLKIIKKFSWINFLILYITFIGVTHFRFYIGYALIFNFVICWFALSGLEIRKRIVYGILMIILFGFLPRIAPLDGAVHGYMGIGTLKNYVNVRTITDYRAFTDSSNTPSQPQTAAEVQPPETSPSLSSIDLDGNFSISIDNSFDNPVSFFKNISVSFIYSVLGPLPWQLKEKRHLFVLPEVIAWYFLLFFIIKGILKSIGKEYKVMLPLIIFSVFIFISLSFYLNNFGVITRIRMPAFLALLCLVPFGLAKLKHIHIPFLEKYFI